MLMAALVICSLAFAVRFAIVSSAQLTAPFDLLYETAAYATVEVIDAGLNPYARLVYDAPPFVLTMYTPTYYYLVSALPAHEGNVFFAGRLLSLVATLVAALCLLIASGRASWSIGVVAVGLFFALWPVSQWAAYVKSDTTALAFSALGVAALHLSRGRAWLLALAALSCVVAISCKQSYIAASAAGALFLLFRDRRSFAIFAAWGAALGLGFLAYATQNWGPGFWFSTVTATGQEITLSYALTIAGLSGPKPLLVIVLGIATLLAVLASRREGLEVVKRSPYLVYAATSCFVCGATLGKMGSSTNYLIEPWLALLMWTAFALSDLPKSALARPLAALAVVALLLASIADLTGARELEYSWLDPVLNERRERFYDQLREEVESLGFENPKVLSFFIWDAEEDLEIFAQSKTYQITDQVILNDAFLYRLLWESGALEIESLVAAIRGKAFDLIITPRDMRPFEVRGVLQPTYMTLMSAVLAQYRLAVPTVRVKGSAGAHYYFVRKTRRRAGNPAP